MRIGVVTKWFNRGQPICGLWTRSALDELGHETFVLARPTKENRKKSEFIARDDVWGEQQGVTEASSYDIPLEEYEAFVADNALEILFFDQNYQFEQLAELRRRAGVKVIGRFVWEQFAPKHVEGAKHGYDVVFSVTLAERERYRALGLETPFVPWGCHPEVTEIVPDRPNGEVTRFIFPGGFLGHRKPLQEVIEAFALTSEPSLRLLVKAQLDREQLRAIEVAGGGDERIEALVADQPRREHLQLFANQHVCVSPSRWEGLGVPLYEATGFGMPIITNDDPPMNEVVEDELNGILVGSHRDGEARSGIPAYRPDVPGLARAFERLGDPAVREQMEAGAREVRERRAWSHTVEGFGQLVDRVL
jgi:glycosyltransferase involved in cell wall biosynthesis